jgi:transcriptional regulator with XRE-family HTH domain
MILKELRLKKGWSQEHLAEISGLSVRTIQRLEKGEKAGIESMNSLASVFEVPVSGLTDAIDNKEQEDMTEDVIGKNLSKRNREFVINALAYVIVMFGFYALFSLFLGLNFITWTVGVAWGVGVAFHGLSLFIPINKDT